MLYLFFVYYLYAEDQTRWQVPCWVGFAEYVLVAAQPKLELVHLQWSRPLDSCLDAIWRVQSIKGSFFSKVIAMITRKFPHLKIRKWCIIFVVVFETIESVWPIPEMIEHLATRNRSRVCFSSSLSVMVHTFLRSVCRILYLISLRASVSALCLLIYTLLRVYAIISILFVKHKWFWSPNLCVESMSSILFRR